MKKNTFYKEVLQDAAREMIADKKILNIDIIIKKEMIKSIVEKISSEIEKNNYPLLIGEKDIKPPQIVSFREKKKIITEVTSFLKENYSLNQKFLCAFFVDSLLNDSSKRNFFNLVTQVSKSKSFEKKVIVQIKNGYGDCKYQSIKEKNTIPILTVSFSKNFGYGAVTACLLDSLKNINTSADGKDISIFFLDDDALLLDQYDYIDTLNKFITREKILFVSGSCFDSHENISSFHSYANFASLPSNIPISSYKPYTQGGGGAAFLPLSSINLKNNFPQDVLPGIYFNTQTVNKTDIKILKGCFAKGFWVNTTLPFLPVEHATKETLHSWSVVRVKYFRSWEKAFSLMEKDKAKIYREYFLKSKQCLIENLIAKYKKSKEIELLLGYIFLTVFYKKELLKRFI
ncbi:MAG: hypothetical protein AUJ23_04095 [Candidatus Magasanikbacteria bacterium CG1_02_32_51]|uniref:Uncharacterized protein n=1 Tax=Candidatus Magasanikbacteria bacterium CG1_02_32_51 TaxID=1805238 RepID=A0A1J4U652_9BACT|nr:MAG: hypothetical protein AUJ23_04095 [Candidatus Magasanikbacteria bacterium CG1_02_32_51]